MRRRSSVVGRQHLVRLRPGLRASQRPSRPGRATNVREFGALGHKGGQGTARNGRWTSDEARRVQTARKAHHRHGRSPDRSGRGGLVQRRSRSRSLVAPQPDRALDDSGHQPDAQAVRTRNHVDGWTTITAPGSRPSKARSAKTAMAPPSPGAFQQDEPGQAASSLWRHDEGSDSR